MSTPMLKKFYCVTFNGEGLPICKQLQDAGVEVLAAIIPDIKDTETEKDGNKKEAPEDKKKRLSMYDNMIPKTTPEKLVAMVLKEKNPDECFVFVDFNLGFHYADMMKDSGICGIYPTEEDRLFEVDREKAKKFVEKNYPDLKVAEEKSFKTIDEAIQFLETSDDIYCVKGFDEAAPTFVPDTDEPIMAHEMTIKKLEQEKQAYEKAGFLLERKIPKAIEITPEAWFVDGKMVGTSVDLELKRIQAGDVGFMTGCACDLVFETEMGAQINELAFPKAVHDMAKKHKSCFIWDASILFDTETNEGYLGEFCPNRPGYNTMYSELALMDDKKQFFESLMEGKNPYENKAHNFASSVRIFNIKQSDGKIEIPEGKELMFDEELSPNVWPMDVKEVDGKLETLAWDYQACVVTGAGDDLKSAAKDVYKNVEQLGFDDKVYRPELDYLSTKYPGSIPNRYKYAIKNNLV